MYNVLYYLVLTYMYTYIYIYVTLIIANFVLK